MIKNNLTEKEKSCIEGICDIGWPRKGISEIYHEAVVKSKLQEFSDCYISDVKVTANKPTIDYKAEYERLLKEHLEKSMEYFTRIQELEQTVKCMAKLI